MNISIVVAIAENGAIGKGQQLLCHLPLDLKRFKEITGGHTIIMGRKTFESLPKGALPNRKNVVLTTSGTEYPNCTTCTSLEEALEVCKEDNEVFIIGGAAVYKRGLEIADKLYITRIHHSFADADTFFPTINTEEWTITEQQDFPTDEKHAYPYTFLTYVRK
jgi:Dihydrofolate reductase